MPRKGGWYGESQRHSEARKKGSSPGGAPTKPKGDGTRFLQRATKTEEPRRPNKTVEAAQERINTMIREHGTYGINARKPVPTGKNVLLMHRTTPEAAEAILTKGVQATNKPNLTAAERKERKENLFGVHASDVKNWEGYGTAVVGVLVPRKSVQRDESMKGFYPPAIKVSVKDLKGRKLKRYK